GLHEAQSGHGLSGAGGVLEPEAPVGVGVVGGLVELNVGVELVALLLPVQRLLVFALAVFEIGGFVLLAGDRDRGELRRLWRRRRREPVAGTVPVALGLRHQRGQGARQRVHLVGREHRPVGQVRLLLGQQPLEAEQQRVLPAPFDRGLVRAGVALGQGGVYRGSASRAGRQGLFEGLALVDELLAREQLRPRDRGRFRKGGGITHTDRKVWRFVNASRGGTTWRLRRARVRPCAGGTTLRKRMPPRRPRLGGIAGPIKAGSASTERTLRLNVPPAARCAPHTSAGSIAAGRKCRRPVASASLITRAGRRPPSGRAGPPNSLEEIRRGIVATCEEGVGRISQG